MPALCIYKEYHIGNITIINKNIIFLWINLKRNIKDIYDNKLKKKKT